MSEFKTENNVLIKYFGSGGEVIIPDGVEIIGSQAFKNCKKLTSVTFPDTVTEIQEKAFHGCSHLKELSLEQNIHIIGKEAFSWCSGLKRLVIGKNIQQIDDKAFFYCYSMTDFIFKNDGIKLNIGAFFQCNGLEHIRILDTDFSASALAEKYSTEYEDIISLYYWTKDTACQHAAKDIITILFGGAKRKNRNTQIFNDIFFTMLRKNPAMPNLLFSMQENLEDGLFQEAVDFLMKQNLFTPDNIDSYIQFAITNQLYETQLILTDYKYQHFDFQNPADKLQL